MKKLICTALLSTLLISCHATARFYPVQGPLATQTPAPVLVGRISGAFYSGTMTLTGLQGEVFQGRWEAVRQPAKSTAAPTAAPADSDMAPLWDSVYGSGFYVAHVLGTRLYARATLAGKTGAGKTGDSLKVEFYRPEDRGNDDAASMRGSVRGVAKDDKGNVYKVTFS